MYFLFIKKFVDKNNKRAIIKAIFSRDIINVIDLLDKERIIFLLIY